MKKRHPLSVVIQDSSGKRTMLLAGDGPWIIGRDPDCEIPLSDDRASRRHARLDAEDRGLVVKDLGSANGTRLDGKTIQGSAPFPSGSRLLIGGATVHLQRAPMKAASPNKIVPPRRSTESKTAAPVRAPEKIAPRARRTQTQTSLSPSSLVLLLGAVIGIGFTVQNLMNSDSPAADDISTTASTSLQFFASTVDEGGSAMVIFLVVFVSDDPVGGGPCFIEDLESDTTFIGGK